MATTPKPAAAKKPAPKKLSPVQLAARIARDSAELAKHATAPKKPAAKKTPAKKAAAKPKAK